MTADMRLLSSMEVRPNEREQGSKLTNNRITLYGHVFMNE
jgi:hypothetical protein